MTKSAEVEVEVGVETAFLAALSHRDMKMTIFDERDIVVAGAGSRGFDRDG